VAEPSPELHRRFIAASSPEATMALNENTWTSTPMLQTAPPISPMTEPGPCLGAAVPAARLVATWARSDDEVRESQRLRYLVFAEEMQVRLSPPAGTPPGHDADSFDAACEHLLVRATGADGTPGPVVGTYRLLTPAAARRTGCLYSDTEFDLKRLRSLRDNMVELGRSCVHPQWRTGGVILALWSALAEFMHRNRFDTMIGCASIGMRDGGHGAASLWQRLRATHLAPEPWRVTPRLALPVDDLRSDLDVEPPPLLKGYLRCGARVLGPPAWDPDFNVADLPLLLRLDDLPVSYRRRLLGT
jgi:putative hemolysin